jgi:dynein heavy chain
MIDSFDDIPFDALAYLIAECNYGGRVTDYFDRRLIKSLLKRFLNEETITNENFKIGEINHDIFNIPLDDISYDGFISTIKQIPLITHPEVFGLHANSIILRDNKEIRQIFDSVLLTLPKKVNESK